MIPATLTVDPFSEGDTWNGIGSVTVEVNGEAYSSPLVGVYMQFRNQHDVLLAECSTANGGAVIVDADEWIFKVPAQKLALKKGRWSFGIKCVAADGAEWTLLAGKIRVLEQRVEIA